MRAWWLRLALWLLLVPWPAVASASVFELFGASPRAVGLAGALSAGASGGEAAFHNPAMLGGATHGSVWAGGSATGFQLNIRLQRPLCTDGWQVCSGQYLGGFASRAPLLPKDSQGFQFGWSYPLGGVLRDKVTLGAGLALPYEIGRAHV